MAADWINLPTKSLSESPWNLGRLDIQEILDRTGLCWKVLGDFGKARIGTKSGKNDVFVVDATTADELDLEEGILLPYAYHGKEVRRYATIHPSAQIIYPYNDTASGSPAIISPAEMMERFPNVLEYLRGHKDILRQRMDSRKLYATGDDWYRHLRAGSFRYICPPKVVVKGIAMRCCAGLLPENTTFDGANCPSIIFDKLAGHDLLYFLGLLNSKVLSYQLRTVCPPKLSGYTRFSASYLTKVPIRVIDFANSAEKSHHDKVVRSVEQMLPLTERLAESKTNHQRTIIQRQIETTDRQIDQLVYELYGLTKEEIQIVEEAAR